MNLEPILAAPIQVQVHLLAAVGALVIGLIIFANRKGTGFHKTLGWTYVVLMLITAGTAIFIRRGMKDPFGLDGITPIHLFIVLTLTTLPLALRAIRRGNVAGHARGMISLYIGAIVIAGALTFLPGRLMHEVAFGG